MEFGELFRKMGKTTESIQRLTEAYLIYKSYFGINAIQTAEAAWKLSLMMEEN